MRDLTNDIIRYENGDMTDEDEVIEFFQRLLDTGLIYHLQGSYQRMAAKLILDGIIEKH